MRGLLRVPSRGSAEDGRFSERAAALLRALTRLARRQREVLELVFYHDMTIEQAGQTLGISIGSARVHYQRGKKRLYALLEARER